MNETDPESDSNCVSAGLRYYMRGFTEFYGLPDMDFEVNAAGAKISSDFIYTHYPQAAEVITGLMYYPCGPGNTSCYRWAPLSFTALSLLVLMWTLILIVSPLKALMLFATVLFVPLTLKNAPNLAYHSYQLGLVILQACTLLRYSVSRDISFKLTLIILGILAFVQGWFSLDHVFIATLMPLPFLFAFGMGEKRRFAILTLASLAGYFLAFGLHFLQVAGYRGGLVEAFQDYAAAGHHRMTNEGGQGELFDWVKPENLNLLNVTRRQLDVYATNKINFGFPFQIIVILSFIGLMLTRPLKLWRWQGQELMWFPNRQRAVGLLFACLICWLWLVVMRQHAYMHITLARGWFFAFFFALFLLLDSVRTKRDAN